jgi:hypothetical protein
MGQLPKTSKANLTNNPTWLEGMKVLYVTLGHMVVATTLRWWIPFIHVDCHLVSCKPIRLLGGDPFYVT